MGFDVSTGASYAVLYSVLGFYTLLAMGSAGWFTNCLPPFINRCCTLKKAPDGTVDYFLSARNSAGVWALGFSYFASGMGAWILYGTTEMGATPQLSWLGVIGYSGASAFPAIIVGVWLGPKVREYTGQSLPFSTTDFGHQRYGRIMQVTIAIISVFYMFIYVVAELTASSGVFATLTNDYSTIYLVSIALSVGIITVFYTTLAGLPSSIITDRFQGVTVLLMVIIVLVAVTSFPENQVTSSEFALASNWTVDGFMAAVTLFLAIASAELFNQCTWQRVWAAESIPAMRKGFLLASFCVFLVMMFFGVMGMISYALDPTAFALPDDDPNRKFSFLSFFYLLEPLATGWQIFVLILVITLSASTIDSLQNGLTSVFYHDLVKFGWSPTWITRILMVLVNVPAIYLASRQYDVISLFLVADLVCATSVFPVFLGLQLNDKFNGWLPAPTELGAFLGCISGIVTVLINGLVNKAPGGLFRYFWLENGAICALCGSKTLVSFIVTPTMSAVMTYIFSFLDIWFRGERARLPVIPVPFDKDDGLPANKIPGDSEESEQDEKIGAENIEADDVENGANEENEKSLPAEEAKSLPEEEAATEYPLEGSKDD